jgi:hypothetical protein
MMLTADESSDRAEPDAPGASGESAGSSEAAALEAKHGSALADEVDPPEESESAEPRAPATLATAAGPAGSGSYVVRQGECIESIAYEHGLFWQTVWDHPGNKELRRVRGNPNALLPGDRVEIPAKRERKFEADTGAHHRLRRRGVPSRLRMQLRSLGEPRADLAYAVIVDGVRHEGATDSDGWLEITISPAAKEAKLEIPDDGETYPIRLRHLDPIEEPSGFKARLANLGYAAGALDEDFGPEAVAAIERFQRDHGLEVTGEPDAATRDKLKEFYPD